MRERRGRRSASRHRNGKGIKQLSGCSYRLVTLRRVIFFGVALSALCLAFESGAAAAEPRPWLCRDKPVFSSDKPVRYEAKSRGKRYWRIFFMQFVPGGPHDGFTITASDDVRAGTSDARGELGSGQFFAVALYLGTGGHWLCPRSVREVNEARSPEVVSSLCYSDEESGPCRVALTISRPAGSSSSAAAGRR